MEASELRIGNWIHSIHGDEKVIDVMCDCINYHNCEDLSFDMIQPIPLTEEILLKCGFKKKNGYGFKLGNIRVSKVDCLTRDEYAFSYYDLWINLRSLHQLQNLYFSLTTKELEINL